MNVHPPATATASKDLANDLGPDDVAAFFEESGAISAAGRKFAERMRDALPATAREVRRAAAIA